MAKFTIQNIRTKKTEEVSNEKILQKILAMFPRSYKVIEGETKLRKKLNKDLSKDAQEVLDHVEA